MDDIVDGRCCLTEFDCKINASGESLEEYWFNKTFNEVVNLKSLALTIYYNLLVCNTFCNFIDSLAHKYYTKQWVCFHYAWVPMGFLPGLIYRERQGWLFRLGERDKSTMYKWSGVGVFLEMILPQNAVDLDLSRITICSQT